MTIYLKLNNPKYKLQNNLDNIIIEESNILSTILNLNINLI